MAEALAGSLKKQSEADSPVEFNFHGGVFYPKGKILRVWLLQR
ncbi:MAG: hypothetical protein ACLTEF_11655 [[Clostridium] leptum]|jgi:hypothetical protein